EPQEPALFIQDRFDLLNTSLTASKEFEHDGWIEIARTRSHYEPLARRIAHACLDGPAKFNGSDAGPITEMTGDEPQLVEVRAKRVGGPLRDIGMRNPMKAVAAKAVLQSKIARDGVRSRPPRERRVKRRIKDRNLRKIGERVAR